MGRKRIFVDTSAWFALQIKDDRNHKLAQNLLRRSLDEYETMVTSNHVVGETYTLLRVSKGYREAGRFLDIIRQSPRLEEYFATPQIEKATFELLRQYCDHAFSFVDGVSFRIMKDEAIRDAFSFDIHFRIAGFNRLGVDTP